MNSEVTVETEWAIPSWFGPIETDAATVETAPLEAAMASLEAGPLLRLVQAVVIKVFGIEAGALLAPSRGHAEVALARQVAMYLAHVVCKVGQTEIGRVFGRDRSTVRHACFVVEDRRDDPRFDLTIELTVAIFWRLYDVSLAGRVACGSVRWSS